MQSHPTGLQHSFVIYHWKESNSLLDFLHCMVNVMRERKPWTTTLSCTLSRPVGLQICLVINTLKRN